MVTVLGEGKHWIQTSKIPLKIDLVSHPAWADCYVLTFWPGQKCHSRWCTGRKWHILMAVMRGNRVGGNWLLKWDEVKKIPLYSHRLTHRKRVTSELHDSYFRSMTITQAIPKIAEVTHPDRQISEEIAEAWRRVHITAWEFEGNIRPTNWTEDRTVELSSSQLETEIDEMWLGKPHPVEGALGSPDWIGVRRWKTQRCRP